MCRVCVVSVFLLFVRFQATHTLIFIYQARAADDTIIVVASNNKDNNPNRMTRLANILALHFLVRGCLHSFFALPVVSFEARPLQTTLLASRLQTHSENDGWVSLTDDGAVKKKIVMEGSGSLPQIGKIVEIDYVGTLGQIDWDVEGVVDCWLSSQQGLENLADKFREHNIDATKLIDLNFFNEDFCAEALGLTSKIQIKKLVMASKRLAKAAAEYPAGTQFDSNQDRNDGAPYRFVLGQKKAIRGMEIVVASMKEGEQAKMKCRTDYAYGKEGVRKTNGDVMVPEYATLCFDLKLIRYSDSS